LRHRYEVSNDKIDGSRVAPDDCDNKFATANVDIEADIADERVEATDSNSHNLNNLKLDNDICCQREEIIHMLRLYGRGRNELIMMVLRTQDSITRSAQIGAGRTKGS
jgi:hypothetical protein